MTLSYFVAAAAADGDEGNEQNSPMHGWDYDDVFSSWIRVACAARYGEKFLPASVHGSTEVSTAFKTWGFLIID